jgi:hypothetical protein
LQLGKLLVSYQEPYNICQYLLVSLSYREQLLGSRADFNSSFTIAVELRFNVCMFLRSLSLEHSVAPEHIDVPAHSSAPFEPQSGALDMPVVS